MNKTHNFQIIRFQSKPDSHFMYLGDKYSTSIDKASALMLCQERIGELIATGFKIVSTTSYYNVNKAEENVIWSLVKK